MSVKISVDYTVTLRELVKRKNEGFVVEATPHIGNEGVRNLASAYLGFTLKLIDSTKGKKDYLFYPDCIISNGQKKQIADSDILTTHNIVHGSHVSVSDFHTASIKRKYSSIITQSEWMASRSVTILEILNVVNAHTKGQIWERYVDANGLVKLPPSRDFSGLPDKIHRVSSGYNEEGWITPNPVNLLCDMICGILESGKDTMYMISDPSMYKYIYQEYRSFGPMDVFISKLYDVVRASGLFSLPEQLNVSMVPLSCLTHFTAPSKLSGELDRKLAYLDRLTQNNKRAGEKQTQKKISAKLMGRMSAKRTMLFQELNNPLALISADPTTGIFYTQHDLLREREDIYVPEIIMDTQLSELWSLADKMERLMRYKVKVKKNTMAYAA